MLHVKTKSCVSFIIDCVCLFDLSKADMDEDSAAAAEVYSSAAGAGDDDDSLVSISAGANILSLVLRRPHVMRFVKYVAAAAVGSRFDLATVYTIQ